MTEYRDVVTIWLDDRACGDNTCNDVLVNGQRLPNLVPELSGQKLSFRLDDVEPGDEGLFFLAVFSRSGTDWTPLPGGLSICLTIDSLTLHLIQPWAIPIFGDTIQNGDAATVPVRFQISAWVTGLVLDLNGPVYVATTDPVRIQ